MRTSSMIAAVLMTLGVTSAATTARADGIDDYNGGWIGRAWKYQRQIDHATPLADNTMMGTHNSFNSADYGYADPNQALSIKDQLRLGARFIELDVHWYPKYEGVFQYPYRMLLCHGESDHAGCSFYDNYLRTGLQEIRDWLKSDDSRDQVILLYLEAYYDGRADVVYDELDEYIGNWIYKPQQCGEIPATLTKAQVLAGGKKVVVWDNRSRDCSTGLGGYNAYVFTGMGGIGRKFEDLTAGSGISGEGSYLYPDDIRDYLLAGVNVVNLDYMVEYDTDRLAAGVWSWDASEPNDAGGNEDCAVMKANGRWNDATCSSSYRYACRDDGRNWKITASYGPWAQGAAACYSEFGGTFTFATPVNATENQKLQALKGGSASVWISSNDIAAEGKWTPDVYLWDTNEPNDSGDEDCATSWGSGKLNDDKCLTSTYAFACRNNAGAWYITSAKGHWYGGDDICWNESGGQYVYGVPRTWAENEALKSAKAAAGQSTVWVAYNDSAVEGSWQSKNVLYTSAVGGNGGGAFDLENFANPKRIAHVAVRTGARVDMISLRYKTGEEVTYGGDGGSLKEMNMRAGERLTYAKACTGSSQDEVHYIRLETNQGQVIEGGSMPSGAQCTVAQSDEITGIHGRSGARIDKLGFIYK
ncbi:lectin-like protein [Sorangium sp. So ce726]|uniref:jacalin-like lectin n=1 Tax=Sorangium sp. So ce726 TaxID=3133319 RepID=UPI003F604517